MKHSFSLLALALFAGSVQAQSAGSFSVRAGATMIRPQVESGDLSAPSRAGTQLDVGDASQLSGGLSYQWTDRIAFDLPLGLASKHDVTGAGSIAGVGKVGEVKALPVTFLVQWRLLEPDAQVQPYLGVGPTYARIGASKSTSVLTGITGGSPSKPTTLALKSAWGVTFQIGATVAITGPWAVDVAYMKTFLSSTGKLSTGQTIDLKLNPDVLAASLVYRF